MTRMLPINGIYYAFFPRSKRLVSIIQMPDAFRAIHHRGHLFQLIISIRTALGQQPHPAYRLTVRVGTYIFKISQPPLVDKAFHTPRLEQHLEQVRERFAAQPARRSRQSQEKSLRPLFPQYTVSLRQGMMRLVHNHNRRAKRKTIYTSAQRLYARHPDVLRQQRLPATGNHPVAYSETRQGFRNLLYQFYPVRHDQHPVRSILANHGGHQECLSRPRRHLHHHAPAPTPPFFIQAVLHLPLIAAQFRITSIYLLHILLYAIAVLYDKSKHNTNTTAIGALCPI